MVFLAACSAGPGQTGPAGPGTAQSQDDPGSPAGAPPSPDLIQAEWQSSPHADTFVLAENGTNSTCARCHAPVNWVPTMDDMPESCASCKFEVQPPPPVIARADWDNVQCNVCHQVKRDTVDPQVVWLEIAAIEQYAAVATINELCLKCHAVGDLAGHLRLDLAGVHQDSACTVCHDAHTTAASCGTSDCHPAAAPAAGHDEAHQSVGCLACHDASGLQVGPDAAGLWTTLEYASHSLQTVVDCQRCHSPGNSWGLVELTP